MFRVFMHYLLNCGVLDLVSVICPKNLSIIPVVINMFRLPNCVTGDHLEIMARGSEL